MKDKSQNNNLYYKEIKIFLWNQSLKLEFVNEEQTLILKILVLEEILICLKFIEFVIWDRGALSDDIFWKTKLKIYIIKNTFSSLYSETVSSR